MIESKSAFAKRIGKDRSWVTRMGQAGRLVLHGEGRAAQVDVEASLERLEATRGTRYDMSEHWASKRGETAAIPANDAHEVEQQPLSTEEIGRRTRLAQMFKEEREAEKRRLEVEEIKGTQINRAAVAHAIAGATAAILGQIENLPDRLAPQVHGIEDIERVRMRIRDETESLCRRVSDSLGRLANAKGQEAA